MKDKNRKYSTSLTYTIEAPEKDYLYIQESQIPGSGMGLFSAIHIYKKEVIAYFKGEILSQGQARKRTEKQLNKYFICMPDGSIMDSMKIKCFAKFANDSKGPVKTNFKNNAKISLDEDDRVCLVAKRKIKAGEEIFCSYGKAYWKSNK